MPFAAIQRPALGMSLLQARLRDQGVACDAAYLNLSVAELLGRDTYDCISSRIPYLTLVGDWVFSEALYGIADPGAAYVDDVLRRVWKLGGEELEHVERARALAPSLITDCLQRIPWASYDLIGFSASCGQNLASLALARRIKELDPGTPVAFGGGDWQDVMGLELHRRFPFVDFACLGEGDHVLPALLAGLRAGSQADLDAIPGLVSRRGRRPLPAAPVMELDVLPAPDYGDYLETLEACGFAKRLRPALVAETSRGCWWGAHEPCRFCGLSGAIRTYRAKSTDRILRELRSIAATPKIAALELADNVVSQGFLTEVLPALADDPLPVPLFLEMRAVADRETMKHLGAARVTVQPGIESLSDHVLELMHKGSSALENVRFLRLCREYGVRPFWNLLHGFPGETEGDYERVLEMLPALRFLEAPLACARFSLDRFSPYFEHPEDSGLCDVRPLAAFRHVYPFPDASLRKIAHVFEFAYDAAVARPAAVPRIRREVEAWQRVLEPGELVLGRRASGPMLTDTRPEAAGYEWILDSLDETLYRACEKVCTRAQLEEIARASGHTNGDAADEVALRLSAFVDRRLMVTDGERYLSLALFRGAV